MKCLKSLERELLGMVLQVSATDQSEVWKAKLPATGELFALKKILMHNEKEGVSLLTELGLTVVSCNSAERDQVAEIIKS